MKLNIIHTAPCIHPNGDGPFLLLGGTKFPTDMRHVGNQLHPQFFHLRYLSLRRKLEVRRNGFPGGGVTSYQVGRKTALSRIPYSLWDSGAVKYCLRTSTPLPVAFVVRVDKISTAVNRRYDSEVTLIQYFPPSPSPSSHDYGYSSY